MASIAVFCTRTSPRLLYVLDWVFGEVLQCSYHLTQNDQDLTDNPFCISYGKAFQHAIHIPDAGLLWEDDIKPQPIETGTWNGIPTLYHSRQPHTVPFDIFSAIFYLLSRYEEYYDYTPDKHGRYPATESIAFKNGWLDRPLVDEWLRGLYELLKDKGAPVSLKSFSCQPTYDIDIAFSYKHKGFLRTVGAITKAALKLSTEELANRVAVLLGRKQDPFDCFGWLGDLHEGIGINPIYFVLASLKTTPYDKNIFLLHPSMIALIRGFKEEGQVGLHPSYFSDRTDVFEREKTTLEEITNSSIRLSRQHYIRLKIPETYRALIAHKISDDWSMGYGSHLGFRAGTGRPFLWYDLKKGTATDLRIHPFCFMDSTARFEEALSAEHAFERLDQMKERLMLGQSTLVTVFHNFSLGSDKGWEGWPERYEQFLKESCKAKVPREQDF